MLNKNILYRQSGSAYDCRICTYFRSSGGMQWSHLGASSTWLHDVIANIHCRMLADAAAVVYWVQPWWRHQMVTFSALLALCAGNSPLPGEFPSKKPVTRSFDVFFDPCLNKRLSKQLLCWWFETPSCSLWRHCNAYLRLVLSFIVSCLPFTAIWHLLVAMTAYQACVLLCFYNSLTGWLPEYHGSLHLWPSNDWLKLGVPYVVIQQRHRIDSPLPMWWIEQESVILAWINSCF